MSLTATIQTYLATSPASALYGREIAVLEAWRGADNLLWRVESSGEELVLKLFLDAGQARSRRQFAGQERFAPYGLAPRPRWYDRYPVGLARQLLVYDWMPGTAVEPGDPGQVGALADAVAQVHAADPQDVLRFSPNPLNLDYLWRMLQTSIRQIDGWLAGHKVGSLQQAFGHTAGAATALVNQARPLWQGAPPAPIHGDLKLENVLQSLGTVVLVDWEFYGLGDPAQEAAAFLVHSQHALGPEQSARWRERYLAQMDQPGLDARIEVYRRLLPFRDLCLLLDGLRQVDAAGEALSAEQAAVLTATVAASWSASGRALGAPADALEPALHQLMRRLPSRDPA